MNAFAFIIGAFMGAATTIVVAAHLRRDSTMRTHRAAMDALAKTATPRNPQ